MTISLVMAIINIFFAILSLLSLFRAIRVKFKNRYKIMSSLFCLLFLANAHMFIYFI